jgi:hypothetical protein
MDDSRLLRRLASLSASAEPEQIDRGVSLALERVPSVSEQTRKRFSWRQSLLLLAVVLGLAGGAGVAVAELTDSELEEGQFAIDQNFEPVLCPDGQPLFVDDEARAALDAGSAVPTCPDGSVPQGVVGVRELGGPGNGDRPPSPQK